MEFHQIRYFLAVSEEQSFTRAAALVNVAQPSLSQQIQKLEEELGCRLFDRLNRRVVLTDAGQNFLPSARRIVREIREASRAVQPASGPLRGIVKAGFLPTLAPYVLGDCLSRFRHLHPEVSVVIHEQMTHNLIQSIGGGELDFAVISTCDQADALDQEKLGKESLALVTHANHPLIQSKRINWKLLGKESFLVLQESNCLAKQTLRWLARIAPAPEVMAPLFQLETLLAMIRSGWGASLIPSMAIPAVQSSGLHIVLDLPRNPTREINLVRNPASRRTQAAEAFAACVKQCVNETKQKTAKLPDDVA